MSINLTASVIVRNELGRYLEPCVSHLLEFCDEVKILDDGSTDGWVEELRSAWGKDGNRVSVMFLPGVDRNAEPAFHRHAEARNKLLQFTLVGWPSHVLSIDADEFVSDGAAVRRACEGKGDLFSLTIQEVWDASPAGLFTREDGGWRSHEIGIVWKPGRFRNRPLAITDRGHATGRVPEQVYRGTRAVAVGCSLLHLGWTRKSERPERFARYRDGDGGKYHARQHIESIMWSDRRVRLTRREWPSGLESRKDDLLERIAR